MYRVITSAQVSVVCCWQMPNTSQAVSTIGDSGGISTIRMVISALHLFRYEWLGEESGIF